MTDRDGDSHMRNLDDSGSEHSSRSSSMFPNEGATTPPQSQPQHSSTLAANQKEDALMGEAGDLPSQQQHSGVVGQGAGNKHSRPRMLDDALETDENAPGYPWQSRRAVEEYEKVQKFLLDPEFSLEEFGDPILEQLQEQQLGS